MPKPAPRRRPADVWHRLGELAPQAAVNIRDQHLVSQTLLRQWTGPWPGRRDLCLASMNLDHPMSPARPAGTSRSGFAPDFLTYASRSAEDLWQVTENRLPDAIRACADGSLFAHPDLAQVVRDAMALHFVRSHQTTVVHQEAWATTRREARAQWLDHEVLLDWAFYKRYGLYPAPRGHQAREAMADELMRPMDALVESGALKRIRIEHIFNDARAIINGVGLEIARPADGEFLIGDTPAVAIRNDRAGIGPLGGIPIGDAHQMVLPLGPGLIASLGPVDAFGTISAEHVDALNVVQVRAARQRVFFRPGSGLEPVVRAALRRHPRQRARPN